MPQSGNRGWHLAQINVGRLIAPVGDPRIQGFVDALDAVSALGEESPGFVWRLRDDAGNSTSFRISDDPRLIVNLTVWESVEALEAFSYRSRHVEFLRRRREWFEPATVASYALWWIPAGSIPGLEDAVRRLAILREIGPSPEAFSFGSRFPVPGLNGDGLDCR